jgi:hypothetical protein
LVDELKLNPETEVKIKDIEVEVVKGELSNKPWFIESKGENYVLLEESQYGKLINFLNKILDENLELKLEQTILSAFPIDFDDVKVVVKKEMEEQNLSIIKALQKVKKEYPNLFYRPQGDLSLDLNDFLEELL